MTASAAPSNTDLHWRNALDSGLCVFIDPPGLPHGPRDAYPYQSAGQAAASGQRAFGTRCCPKDTTAHEAADGLRSLQSPISTRRVVQPTRHEPTRTFSAPRPRTTHDTVRAPVVPRVCW